MILIPVSDLNDQIIELTLSGASFFLQLSWNDTCQFWSASIQDSGQNAIVSGYAINPGRALFFSIVNSSLPAGYIMAIAPDRRDLISRNDLVSGIVVLVYADASDLPT